MIMKKSITVLVLTLFVCSSLLAQRKSSKRVSGGADYTTALGIKFYPGAISLKHFVNEKNAIEGLGYFWERGGRITGLYEIHGDINGADGLRWYVGPGAHIGFYNAWYYNNKNYNRGTYFGIDGVLGLDYKIKNAPLNLSLDWQPSFEFGYGPGFTGNWGGFAIRYVFK
jgi:hypothetical protein